MKRANHWLGVLSLIAMSAFAQGALAATCTSIATTQTDWNKGAAWDNGGGCGTGQPPTGATVIIDTGTSILADASTNVVGNVTINSGGILSGQAGNTISLSGNLTNIPGGTFTAGGGIVSLFNLLTPQTISGTFTFADLMLNNLLGGVTFSGNVTVTGAFTPGLTPITVEAGSTLTVGGTTYTGPCASAIFIAATYCGGGTKPPAPLAFDAFEQGSTVGGHIWTHIAGQQFQLDVVKIRAATGGVDTGYTSRITVGLVDASAAGFTCATAVPVTATVSPGANTRMTSGKTTYTFTVPAAYKNLQVQVTDRNGVVTCPNDHFAVRPSLFTVSSSNANADATGASATATPVVKAGANFALTATAVTATSTTDTGYAGTPTLDNAQLAAHAGAVRNGTLAGTFGAAVAGVASGTAFTYDDVGYFMLNANGVVDATFTAVDSAVGDCVINDAIPANDFSNTPNAAGKVGCKFGNTAATSYFGRFIPDHFDTAVVATATTPMPCPTGLTCPVSYDGFVYSGQPFSVQVSARNTTACAGGSPDACTTQNYQGTFAQTVTLSAAASKGGAVIATGGAGQPTIVPANIAGFGSGVATTSGAASSAFTFAVVATPPTDVYVRANDTDGASSLRGASSVEGGVKVASGQIKISNAYGSELLPLTMTATVQYCSAVAGGNCTWTKSTTDSATSFNTAADIVAQIIDGPLAGGDLKVSGGGAVTVGGGSRTFTFGAPNKTGSANISLGAPAYLSPNAAGRATFGVYKGNEAVIYRGRRGR
ncbi:hypothetical protein FGKAn22_03440 [Ferrigenium kumadai]|uniref:DUF6701 domain-containing protein n=1 Tax=Ferrigenium kumadai TaxID=1682490 RepID=A0AAN1SY21_9PROT|nr:DUF6701 domain-containing protein [Ferrigenium kumadai]BBI98651.1 hypothetical protein FGKAn22_03440 [Ferrigenium kumadai]